MKGHQGLEALAALCGGASRAPRDQPVVSGLPQESQDSGTRSAAPTTTNTSESNASSPSTPNDGVPAAGANIPITQIQQWQQQMAAAYGGMINPAAALAAASILQAGGVQGLPLQGPQGDATTLAAMQQLAYVQYMQMTASQAQLQAQAREAAAHTVAFQRVAGNPDNKSTGNTSFSVQASQLANHQGNAEAEGNGQTAHEKPAAKKNTSTFQVIPGASSVSTSETGKDGSSRMQPPPPPSQVTPASCVSSGASLVATTSSPAHRATLTLQPSHEATILAPSSLDASNSDGSLQPEDKKQLKRAANRRSAQLSRKRKKQFIEELKEENDGLRRKEQILKSIPDLIVVFDSAGKIWFVSHSVAGFLDFSPKDLEGSSFWDRLCDDSVRLLKAAFMDALAARESGMSTIPLGSGYWELRLVDRDGSHKVVTLNGVVHFSNETPECVCSIRLREDDEGDAESGSEALHRNASVYYSSSFHGNISEEESSGSVRPLLRPHIQPQQSVISNSSSTEESSVRMPKGSFGDEPAAAKRRRVAAGVSDGESGSIVSESGSDE